MNRNLLINGLIVMFAAAAGFALSMKPWQAYTDQQRSADQAIESMKIDEAKREDLVREQARLRSSIGKEELARTRGWLPKGEVAAPK